MISATSQSRPVTPAAIAGVTRTIVPFVSKWDGWTKHPIACGGR